MRGDSSTNVVCQVSEVFIMLVGAVRTSGVASLTSTRTRFVPVHERSKPPTLNTVEVAPRTGTLFVNHWCESEWVEGMGLVTLKVRASPLVNRITLLVAGADDSTRPILR